MKLSSSFRKFNALVNTAAKHFNSYPKQDQKKVLQAIDNAFFYNVQDQYTLANIFPNNQSLDQLLSEIKTLAANS